MTYVEKLEEWYQTERKAGRVVDVKFGPVSDELQSLYATNPEEAKERLAKATYEVLTGAVESWPLDLKTL